MHQYKTVAQILLILSIFNLVFAAPVVREKYDAHDDMVAPVVVRNVAAISKERRQSGSDEPTPSHSSPPPPDGSTPSHSSSPSPDGPTPLQGSSLSDGPALAPLHESPLPPGGAAALAVSTPPGGTASSPVVPVSDPPVPVHSTSTTQHYTAVTHDMLTADRLSPQAEMKRYKALTKAVVVGGTIIVITGSLLWHNRHNLRRETNDPDCSTAKASGHPCLDY